MEKILGWGNWLYNTGKRIIRCVRFLRRQGGVEFKAWMEGLILREDTFFFETRGKSGGWYGGRVGGCMYGIETLRNILDLGFRVSFSKEQGGQRGVGIVGGGVAASKGSWRQLWPPVISINSLSLSTPIFITIFAVSSCSLSILCKKLLSL